MITSQAPCAWPSLPSAAKRRRSLATGPALAGKKGMIEHHRQDGIVAVLPWLELAAVDAVVAHKPAQSHAPKAVKEPGWTAARAERTKRTRFRTNVPDHAAFRFVPFAAEACGYMGNEAVKFLKNIAAESGRIPNCKGKPPAVGDVAEEEC